MGSGNERWYKWAGAMGGTTHRYFCYGLLCASLVWALLLLLFLQLSVDRLPAGTGLHRRLEHMSIHDNSLVLSPVRKPAIQWNTHSVEKEKLAGAGQLSSELGMIYSVDDQDVRDFGYQRHAFNLLISNRLGVLRPIPDTRHPRCADKEYPSPLPQTSVVICFYNEAQSTLLRTVHTLLARTPAPLLHEILLVDDASNLDELQGELERYVRDKLPSKVQLVRNEKREGLIRGRVAGAVKATGEVLVFLDSHCEVNQHWLEPLLSRIQEHPSSAVCPIIDIINPDTFSYSASPLVRGGFNWGLHFRWDAVPPELLSSPNAEIEPIRSPTMAGGLFAMRRDYFNQLGKYDQGMDIWGGENLEISFRIWMCGGLLEIIPCSRVGHVFRRRRPYGSPGGHDTTARNSLRLAHVWLDKYKENFFLLRPELRNADFGNVSERTALRHRLGCKTFAWYLQNVYPEMDIAGHGPPPRLAVGKISHKAKVVQRGRIRHLAIGSCLAALGHPSDKGGRVTLRKCSLEDANQVWLYNEDGELILASLLCLDASENRPNERPRLMKCHGSGGSQQWALGKYNRLYHAALGQCLVAVRAADQDDHITMAICDRSVSQQWQMEE
uniref:polypeptide N-acetylgalactosaminyltransferase 11 n=1 Tax=Myxine glutinosa TaxID=7769 RepID=UPI00358E5217